MIDEILKITQLIFCWLVREEMKEKKHMTNDKMKTIAVWSIVVGVFVSV